MPNGQACPESGEKRKRTAHARNDANDPQRTLLIGHSGLYPWPNSLAGLISGRSPYGFPILIIPLWLDYDSSGCSGTVRVPMLRVFRSFDGSEILIIAAATILVASITFLF